MLYPSDVSVAAAGNPDMKVKPLLLWVDPVRCHPDTKDSKVLYAESLGFDVITKESSADAKVWLSENKGASLLILCDELH